ncbi:hypothetical protein B7463_g7970, partial [Scytalidium lignicola]
MESVPDHRPSNGTINGRIEDKNPLRMSTTFSHHGSQSNGGTNNVRSPTSPVTTPPYWEPSHQRTSSNISVESIMPGVITLQDNTEDHIVINGSRTGIGAFVVWNIKVETLEGGSIDIRKRYSEFDDLRYKLLQTFPNSAGAMPPLPPKSVISKFRPKFLENRRTGLQYFLNCILLNPEFSGSPILKEFLFS